MSSSRTLDIVFLMRQYKSAPLNIVLVGLKLHLEASSLLGFISLLSISTLCHSHV